MNVELLDKVLDAEKNVKFIYTIPNFQNPAGVCMSVQKRKALYETAKRHGVMIVEDNPYGDTCFDGVCPPSVKSLDEDGIVIYAGSFSKVISPGLICPRAVRRDIQNGGLQTDCGRAHVNSQPDDMLPFHDRRRL